VAAELSQRRIGAEISSNEGQQDFWDPAVRLRAASDRWQHQCHLVAADRWHSQDQVFFKVLFFEGASSKKKKKKKKKPKNNFRGINNFQFDLKSNVYISLYIQQTIP
jgi:hypothetical protein